MFHENWVLNTPLAHKFKLIAFLTKLPERDYCPNLSLLLAGSSIDKVFLVLDLQLLFVSFQGEIGVKVWVIPTEAVLGVKVLELCLGLQLLAGEPFLHAIGATDTLIDIALVIKLLLAHKPVAVVLCVPPRCVDRDPTLATFCDAAMPCIELLVFLTVFALTLFWRTSLLLIDLVFEIRLKLFRKCEVSFA